MMEDFKMETCIKKEMLPLSINCAQRYTPEIRTELSKLRNVISYLHEDMMMMSMLSLMNNECMCVCLHD